MLKRQRITLAQSQKALDAYHQIPLRLIDVDLSSALYLAENRSTYAYDAYVLNCALKLQCELLTLDQGLSRISKQLGIKVIEVKS